jgi:probable addiction module antidote protein
MPRNLNYKADLLEDLENDPGFAAAYLSAAIADSREAFLIALRDVTEAQKGMSQLANEAKVNRENLYRTLSEDGNPRFSTLESVLNALGMDLAVKLKTTPKRKSASRPRMPLRSASRSRR